MGTLLIHENLPPMPGVFVQASEGLPCREGSPDGTPQNVSSSTAQTPDMTVAKP